MPVSITPVQLATYVRHELSAKARGALVVRGAADGDLVLGVFGNDRYRLDRRVGREVELVRQWLTAAGARDLGFGLSPDGLSWAVLLRIDNRRYRTAAGRAFYAELVRAAVEEEVEHAWAEACGSEGSPAAGRR